MAFSVEQTGACTRKVTVQASAEQVRAAFAKAWRKVAKDAQLPGFRPGKAPRALVLRHYGAALQQEAQSHLIESTLYPVLEEASLVPITTPRVQLDHLQEETACDYTVFIEVRPEITLGKFKGLQIPKVPLELEANKIDAELEALQRQHAQIEPVSGRDVAQTGDMVQLDYEGFLGDAPFEGGKADNALVELGGKDYIPGFSEGLEGAKVPGEREVKVTFPDDYSAKQLAGKEARFVMQLKELKSRTLPALDDEFAKDLGEASLAALRQKIEDNLQSEANRVRDEVRRKHVLQALLKENPVEAPQSMVESQTERLVQNAQQRVERMVGQSVPLESPQLQALRQSSVAEADFQVRSGLMLLEVAKTAGIEVNDADVDAEIERIAASAGDYADQVRYMYAAAERRDQLSYGLLEDKTVAHLLEHAEETDDVAPPQAATGTGA